MKRFLKTLVSPALAAIALGSHAAPIVVDNDAGAPGFTTAGAWTLSVTPGYNGGTYVYSLAAPPLVSCTWTPVVPSTGVYEVYAVFLRSGNRTPNAAYTITHANGQTVVNISQLGSGMAQVPLGVYTFNAGTGGSVRLDNSAVTGAYIADAIIFDDTDDPPSVPTVAHAPGMPLFSDTVTITAQAIDDRGISGVTLTYQLLPSGSPVTGPMFDDGAHGDGAANDGVYGASIPAQAAGTTVNYMVTVTDTAFQTASSAMQAYTTLATAPPEYRCVWADTWNASILNASQVQDIVNTCRANNINTIIAEVRKIGDAYYNSAYEPRATNISGGASFDPLGYLIQLASDTSGGKKKIHVHPWFVMHRIGRGETLSPLHVLSQHPEYEMLKSDGTTLASNRYLDPGHPGSVEHNIKVILDCASKYNFEGVNLDYIRYPEYTGSWGYNAVSVARFNAVHNRTGQPATNDPLWAAWRRECVSLQVKKLYVKLWQLKPEIMLTACTINWGYSYNNFPASSAYAGVYQDWVGWLNEGIMDYNALMNYSTDNTRYNGWTNLSLANDNKRGSIIGIGAYLQPSIQASMNQLLYARSAGSAGLNIYDWGSEVQGSTTGETRSQFYAALKSQVFPTWADPPAPAWKTSPVHGIFEGTVKALGVPVDHATVEIAGMPQTKTVTDGTGWYGMLEVPPGSHTLVFSKAGQPTVNINTTIPQAGAIITVDAELHSPSQVQGWEKY